MDIHTSGPFGWKKYEKYEKLHNRIKTEISQYDKISARISKTMKKMGVEPLPPMYENSEGYEDLETAMYRIRKHCWFNIPEIREYHERMNHKEPIDFKLLEKRESKESKESVKRGKMPTLKKGKLGYISQEEYKKMNAYYSACETDVGMSYGRCDSVAIEILNDCGRDVLKFSELHKGGIHEIMPIIDKMYENVIERRREEKWAWEREPQKSSGNPFIVSLRY